MLKAMGIAPREATPVAAPLASQDPPHSNSTASSSKNSTLGKRKAPEVKVEGDTEDEIPSDDARNKILELEVYFVLIDVLFYHLPIINLERTDAT